MRPINRRSIAQSCQRYLNKRQGNADVRRVEAGFSAIEHWKASRKTAAMNGVLATLKLMAGEFERCMYCHDSHGTDIEHFWPKNPYADRMYVWDNMLLCCTECGRLKGDRFPLEEGNPLIIDPTTEDPWDHLDFDPVTGIISPRFIVENNDYSRKGEATIQALHLDTREVLQKIYKRTLNRILLPIEAYLYNEIDIRELILKLIESDDAGLVSWVLNSGDVGVELIDTLKRDHEAIFNIRQSFQSL